MASAALSPFHFASDADGVTNLAPDDRIALLAACIALQQRAGFRDLLDLRQFACPDCKAPGFNTGWGYLRFTCEAEWLPDEVSVPCKRRAA